VRVVEALRVLIADIDAVAQKLPVESGSRVCPVREAKFLVGRLIGQLSVIAWESENVVGRGYRADSAQEGE
jgi:hypothetical protein